MDNHQIEKQVLLKANLDQVWSAITNSNEFGSWFGMKLEGPFKEGATIRGLITPTTVDAKVAEMQKPHAGKAFELVIDQIKPRTLFSFRWHPYAVDEKTDYTKEPMTLVSFILKDQKDAVLLTITETGFENIPASRRAEAIKANAGGWAKQTELVSKYLAIHSE